MIARAQGATPAGRWPGYFFPFAGGSVGGGGAASGFG